MDKDRFVKNIGKKKKTKILPLIGRRVLAIYLNFPNFSFFSLSFFFFLSKKWGK